MLIGFVHCKGISGFQRVLCFLSFFNFFHSNLLMNTFAAERVSCPEHCVFFSRILGILDTRLLFQSYVPITRDSMLSYVTAILFFLRTWTARAKNNITESKRQKKKERGKAVRRSRNGSWLHWKIFVKWNGKSTLPVEHRQRPIDLFRLYILFPNADHVMILRRFDPLSCSLRRVRADIFMLALMNKTKD